MTAGLSQLLRRARPALSWIAVIATSLQIARSQLPLPVRAVSLAAGALVAFLGARRAERALRRAEERLREERARRAP